MGVNDFLGQLRRRPFLPFRVVTGDGTTYQVDHPDLVVVTPTSAVIGYPSRDHPGAADRYDVVSMRHIIRLEPMATEPADPGVLAE